MRKISDIEIENILKIKKLILIKKYMGNKKKETRITVKDIDGYFYDKSVSNIYQDEGKRGFVSSSNPYSLKNISQWLLKNNKNFTLLKNNKYVNNTLKLNFICKICSSIFYCNWNGIKDNQGCPYCCGRKVNDTNSLANKYPFLLKEWDYNKNLNITPFEITPGSGKKVWWICSKGHSWNSVVGSRTKQNTGCPRCNISKGELKISKLLNNLNLYYIKEYRFIDCKNIACLPFDFYLPEYNLCIEYQGEQHYHSFDFFGGKKALKELKKRDRIKKKYCKNNNINFLEISYKNYNSLDDIVEKAFITIKKERRLNETSQ
jgi:hypothetical protein